MMNRSSLIQDSALGSNSSEDKNRTEQKEDSSTQVVADEDDYEYDSWYEEEDDGCGDEDTSTSDYSDRNVDTLREEGDGDEDGCSMQAEELCRHGSAPGMSSATLDQAARLDVKNAALNSLPEHFTVTDGAANAQSRAQAPAQLQSQVEGKSQTQGGSEFDTHETGAIPDRVFMGSKRDMSGGKRRLASDLYRIMQQDTDELGFSLEPRDEESMDVWSIRLFDFPEHSRLYHDLKMLKDQFVELEMSFPDAYPFEPPFVRVIRPRFQPMSGFIINGALCMELLSKEGWNPINDIESVIVSIRSMILLGNARVDVVVKQEKTVEKKEKRNKSIQRVLRVFHKCKQKESAKEGERKEETKEGQRESRKNESETKEEMKEEGKVVDDSNGPAHVNAGLVARSNIILPPEKAAPQNPVDGGSYRIQETMRAHDYIYRFHKRKGWDQKGQWAKIG